MTDLQVLNLLKASIGNNLKNGEKSLFNIDEVDPKNGHLTTLSLTNAEKVDLYEISSLLSNLPQLGEEFTAYLSAGPYDKDAVFFHMVFFNGTQKWVKGFGFSLFGGFVENKSVFFMMEDILSVYRLL